MNKIFLASLCLFACLAFHADANDGKKKPPVSTSIYDTIVQILIDSDKNSKE